MWIEVTNVAGLRRGSIGISMRHLDTPCPTGRAYRLPECRESV